MIQQNGNRDNLKYGPPEAWLGYSLLPEGNTKVLPLSHSSFIRCRHQVSTSFHWRLELWSGALSLLCWQGHWNNACRKHLCGVHNGKLTPKYHSHSKVQTSKLELYWVESGPGLQSSSSSIKSTNHYRFEINWKTYHHSLCIFNKLASSKLR